MKRRDFRTTAIQPVASLLDRDPSAMQMMQHASLILKANRLYQQFMPTSLARISRVANIKSGSVIIHTEHGAAANKLKQQTQHLISEFIKKGFECTGIEIRVQATQFSEPEHLPTQKPMSEQAIASLREAANGMRADSPLKAKIDYLIEHAARR